MLLIVLVLVLGLQEYIQDEKDFSREKKEKKKQQSNLNLLKESNAVFQ